MKKLLLIVNPKAGRSKSYSPFYKAISTFSQHDYLVHVHETVCSGDATEIVRKMGEEFDMIVCAGGDGTLNETINGVMQLSKKPKIGYLPCGSTNDFATSLGLSSNIVSQSVSIMNQNSYALDIGSFNERYFTYVASFGAFTKSSYSAPQGVKNALGHFAYVLEGITDLSTLRPYKLTVSIENEFFQDEYLFGAICNSTSLGGLVKLSSKEVKMDDGLFEMLLIKVPKNILELNELVASITLMKYDSKLIVLRHVPKAIFETEEDIPWSLDGEFAPSCEKIVIENHHGAVSLQR